MPEFKNFKSQPIFTEIERHVEEMIERAIEPLKSQIKPLEAKIQKLENELRDLRAPTRNKTARNPLISQETAK